ncbi:MAG: Gfo/Idh/MocA family oxidoreductase [Spirochaetota bacterium]
MGYGTIGRIHTLCYRELPHLYPGKLPRIDLSAICTSKPESARNAALEGGYAAWFTSVKDLIRCEQVSVVDCSNPNYLHRQTLLEAFNARKHVYCEKPLALNGNVRWRRRVEAG